MTLIFKVDPDILQVDIWPKFGDYSINGSAVRVEKAKVLGYWKKQRNKEIKKLGET